MRTTEPDAWPGCCCTGRREPRVVGRSTELHAGLHYEHFLLLVIAKYYCLHCYNHALLQLY